MLNYNFFFLNSGPGASNSVHSFHSSGLAWGGPCVEAVGMKWWGRGHSCCPGNLQLTARRTHQTTSLSLRLYKPSHGAIKGKRYISVWARKVPPWEGTPGLRWERCNSISKVNRVCRCARLLCRMCSMCARASVGCVHVFGMRSMRVQLWCVHVCS